MVHLWHMTTMWTWSCMNYELCELGRVCEEYELWTLWTCSTNVYLVICVHICVEYWICVECFAKTIDFRAHLKQKNVPRSGWRDRHWWTLCKWLSRQPHRHDRLSRHLGWRDKASPNSQTFLVSMVGWRDTIALASHRHQNGMVLRASSCRTAVPGVTRL
jgi:hypothetical protein